MILVCRCYHFKRHPLPGWTQAGMEARVYAFTTQAAVLLGSDAGSDGVEPAFSFVFQNHQIWCFIWGCTCNVRGCCTHNAMKDQDPTYAGMNRIPNTSSPAIEITLSCLGQAHSNKSGTALVIGMKAWSLDIHYHSPLGRADA